MIGLKEWSGAWTGSLLEREWGGRGKRAGRCSEDKKTGLNRRSANLGLGREEVEGGLCVRWTCGWMMDDGWKMWGGCELGWISIPLGVKQ
jgi:hypothetical protein